MQLNAKNVKLIDMTSYEAGLTGDVFDWDTITETKEISDDGVQEVIEAKVIQKMLNDSQLASKSIHVGSAIDYKMACANTDVDDKLKQVDGVAIANGYSVSGKAKSCRTKYALYFEVEGDDCDLEPEVHQCTNLEFDGSQDITFTIKEASYNGWALKGTRESVLQVTQTTAA